MRAFGIGPKALLALGLTAGLAIVGLGSLSWLSQSKLPAISRTETSGSPFPNSSDRRGLATHLEALSVIEQRAIFVTPPLPREALRDISLRSWLLKQDPYSDFLSAEETARMRELQSGRYLGLGMEIERAHDGRVLCFPYADSPAERAGLQNGDVLDKINGVSIRELSMAEIAMMSTGKAGTHLSLEIERKGRSSQLQVPVGYTDIKDVEESKAGPFTILAIRAFTSQTPAALEDHLSQGGASPIVIDLRMNRGGDFHAAVDAARLFLGAGSLVVATQSRSETREYRAEQDGRYATARIILWQDEYTASAAELFIAALVDNHRARSIGRKSFGKGTKQDIIALADGSTLILSTATLLTPNGVRYNQIGLAPDYLVPGNASDFDAFLAKTSQLADR